MPRDRKPWYEMTPEEIRAYWQHRYNVYLLWFCVIIPVVLMLLVYLTRRV